MKYVYLVYKYDSDEDRNVFCVCDTQGLAQRYVERLQKNGWLTARSERWRVYTKGE